MIIEKVVYITADKTFTSRQAAEGYRHDMIGTALSKHLSDAGVLIGPGKRIALTNILAEHRAQFTALLDY